MFWRRGWSATVSAMDLEPDVPRYVQLAAYLRAKIDDGTYPPRTRIPSEVSLVQETGFARDTVRKAIALLVTEERVYIVRGMGTFVTAPGG
jgi:GntR family transcriptional regulator